MREIHHILFDLDGTLVDSRGAIGAALRHALDRLDRQPPAGFEVERVIGLPLLEIFRDAFGIEGERADLGIAHYRDHYDREARSGTRVYNHVEAALGQLRVSGRRLFVATVKPTQIAEKVLVEMGLDAHFAGVAGSSLDHARRVKADIIGHALRRFDLDPTHSAMIGDRAEDVRGARVHGLCAVGVTYGFGTLDELRGAAPDYLVDCPSRIAPLLTGIDGVA
jgi:phosphoglycolate phosphatase